MAPHSLAIEKRDPPQAPFEMSAANAEPPTLAALHPPSPSTHPAPEKQGSYPHTMDRFESVNSKFGLLEGRRQEQGEAGGDSKCDEEAGHDMDPRVHSKIPSISMLSEWWSSSRLSGASVKRQGTIGSVTSVVAEYFHHMPRWQYRLLLGIIITLSVSLALLLTASLLYGFGMVYPRIQVTDLQVTQVVLMPSVNATFSSTLLLANPNTFAVKVAPSVVKIYSDPAHTGHLGDAPLKAFRMEPHQEDLKLSFESKMSNMNQLPGGHEMVHAYVTGGKSIIYATNELSITVQGLGLVPMARRYRLRCEILHFWGPEKLTISDCWGRFLD